MQKEKTIQFWDNYHDENHSEEWISKPGEDLLAMISDQIDACKGNKDDPRRRVVSILEIGCGTSTLVRDLKQYIEKRNPMIDVVACGTDVSSVCIEVNRKRDCPLYSSTNTDSKNIDNRLDDETSTSRGLLWYEVLNVIDGEPSRQNWDLIIDKGCLDTFLFRSRQRGTHNKTYPESLRILLDNIHGWQSTAAAITASASVSDGIDGMELHDDEEQTNRQEQRKPGIYVFITPRPKLKAVRDYAGFSSVKRYSLPKIYRSKLEGRNNNDKNSEGLLDREPSDNCENNSIESQKASTSTNSPGFMFVCVKNDDYQVGLSIPFPTAISRDGSNNPRIEHPLRDNHRNQTIVMSKPPKAALPPEVQSIVDRIKEDCAASTENFRHENKKFLKYLSKFFDCREQMGFQYEFLDPEEVLKNYVLQFIPERPQQESKEGTPVKNMDELYEAANIVLPQYQALIGEIVAKANKNLSYQQKIAEAKFAPLKGKERAQEKADDKYSKQEPGPSVSWLYDIVRGSILCQSTEGILMVLDLIQKEPSISIVKGKNRFQDPTLAGYCDFNLCVQLVTKQNFKHICEVQIHLAGMKNLSLMLDSHSYYEYFRTYFSGATDSLKERLDDLKEISKGKNFNEAYVTKIRDLDRLKRIGGLFEEHLCELMWALRIHLQILEIVLAQYGSDHSSVAVAYMNMGLVLAQQNKLEDAMCMYEQCLEIYKNVYGEDHSSVATTYIYMGNILEKQNKLEEAMCMYQQCLEVKKKVYGEDHKSVATTYNSMGIVLRQQNKLEEAMCMYQQSLEIYKNVYGEDHKSVAPTYMNMGLVLEEQTKLEEAMRMYQQSLEINKKVYGEDHSSVATTYNNMGNVLVKQNKLEEAMCMHQQSLEIYKKVYGEDHSSVAATYNNMGFVLQEQNKLEEAMCMYQQSFEINKKVYGEDHSSVADTYNNMGFVLVKQNKLEEAMCKYQQSLKIYKKVYGEDHSSVADTYKKLAIVRGFQIRRFIVIVLLSALILWIVLM